MADVIDALVLDLLEWVAITPRPYAEVIEVWRTSCPRLPVWEDANDRGFIERRHEHGRGEAVGASAAGLEYLRQHRTPAANPESTLLRLPPSAPTTFACS